MRCRIIATIPFGLPNRLVCQRGCAFADHLPMRFTAPIRAGQERTMASDCASRPRIPFSTKVPRSRQSRSQGQRRHDSPRQTAETGKARRDQAVAKPIIAAIMQKRQMAKRAASTLLRSRPMWISWRFKLGPVVRDSWVVVIRVDGRCFFFAFWLRRKAEI